MRPPAWLQRLGWGLTDQVISSATNAALSILIARAVGTLEFGGFSVAFIVFSLFVGLSRSLCSSPLGIRFAAATQPEFRRAAAAATGTSFTLGLVGGLTCLLSGLLIGGVVGQALVALSLPLPALLLQDAWRYAFFAQAHPARAALNDAVWAAVQLIGVYVLLSRGVGSVAPFVLAWGGAAVAAAALGVYQARVVPAPFAAARWIREHVDLTRYLVAEFSTLQACNQATMLIITAIATATAVGSLRGAQVILGPATLLAVSLHSFALPEFSRRRRELTEAGWIRAAMMLSTAVTAIGVSWGLLFFLLPARAGEALLGETWSGTHDVLLASLVGQAGAAIATGPATMLYAMERAAVTMRIHTVQAPLVVVFGVTGVLFAGAQGAAWGLAAAFWVAVPAWFLRLRQEARRAGQQRFDAPAPNRVDLT